VRTLVDGRRGPGDHLAEWDGRDRAGRGVPSGAYAVRLTAGGTERMRRVTLVK
jgi:flagellar hook assembly protein FlgD